MLHNARLDLETWRVGFRVSDRLVDATGFVINCIGIESVQLSLTNTSK